jgi:hypothetical protein
MYRHGWPAEAAQTRIGACTVCMLRPQLHSACSVSLRARVTRNGQMQQQQVQEFLLLREEPGPVACHTPALSLARVDSEAPPLRRRVISAALPSP